MLSLSLVDPLPQQAATLYEVRQSKINLIKSTSNEIDKLSQIIEYLKDLDTRNELLTDQNQCEQLFKNVIAKLKQQTVDDSTQLMHENREVHKIICMYRRKNTFNGNIEEEITQTIHSKLLLISHIAQHIFNLREEIKTLINKIKRKTFECAICAATLRSDQLYVISKCHHQLCRCCFRRHIFTSIERKKEEPKCPFPECGQVLSHYDDLQTILTQQEYEKLNYQLNMTAISRLRGIRYCLTPDCDYAMEYDISGCSKKVKVTKFTCNKCASVWCLDCQLPWHQGFDTCSVWKRSKKYERFADEKYGKWYKANRKSVKQCPGCDAHVEKNEGCNHMTCLCRTEWCWLCNKVIEGGVYDHYGWFHPQHD